MKKRMNIQTTTALTGLFLSFAATESSFAQSAPPPTITLEIPIEAAGHSFQFFDDYSATLLYAGAPFYDALTQKFLVVGTAQYGVNSYVAPRLVDDTTGLSLDLGGFYVTGSTTFQPSLFGGGTIGFAVNEDRYGNVLGLVVPSQGWAFPVTSTGLAGLNVTDSDGNTEFSSFGFFNVFSNTYDASLSGANVALADLTTNHQSPTGTTDLRGATWGARTVFPTRAATFSLGTVDWQYSVPPGYSFTLHTSSGSLQSLTPYVVWTGDTYKVSVSGQVGIGESYWLTNHSGTETTSQFYMDVGMSEVVQSGAPIGVPYTNVQSLTFSIGENHWNEMLAVQQNGALLPLTRSWSSNYLTTWDQTGTEITYAFDYATASVDVNLPWSLVSFDYWGQWVIQDFGQVTELLDGFTPWNPVDSVGSVNFAIAAGRSASLDSGQLRLRNQDGTEWLVSPIGGESFSYEVSINGSQFSVPYRLATAPSTAFQTAGGESVTVADLSTGETNSFQLNTMNYELVTWAPLTTLQLILPAQRWSNNIRVRTVLGDDVPVSREALQGLWSGGGSFTSYGIYTATANISAGVTWWVYDEDAQESPMEANTTDLSAWVGTYDTVDSDSDGLPDWYEYIRGTSESNPDTDGDGIFDIDEISANTSPVIAKPVLTVTAPTGAAWVN